MASFVNPFPTSSGNTSKSAVSGKSTGFVDPFTPSTPAKGKIATTNPFENFNATLDAQANQKSKPIVVDQPKNKGIDLGKFGQDLVSGAETIIKGLKFSLGNSTNVDLRPASETQQNPYREHTFDNPSQKQVEAPKPKVAPQPQEKSLIEHIIKQTKKQGQFYGDIVSGFLGEQSTAVKIASAQTAKGNPLIDSGLKYEAKTSGQKIGKFLNEMITDITSGQAGGINQAFEGLGEAAVGTIKGSSKLAPIVGKGLDQIDIAKSLYSDNFKIFLNKLKPLDITFEDLGAVVNGKNPTLDQMAKFEKFKELQEAGLSPAKILKAAEDARVNPKSKIFDFLNDSIKSVKDAITKVLSKEEQKLLESGTSGLENVIPKGEYTPEQILGKVINSPLENTAEGKQIVKVALDAQSKGTNIVVDSAVNKLDINNFSKSDLKTYGKDLGSVGRSYFGGESGTGVELAKNAKTELDQLGVLAQASKDIKVRRDARQVVYLLSDRVDDATRVARLEKLKNNLESSGTPESKVIVNAIDKMLEIKGKEVTAKIPEDLQPLAEIAKTSENGEFLDKIGLQGAAEIRQNGMTVKDFYNKVNGITDTKIPESPQITAKETPLSPTKVEAPSQAQKQVSPTVKPSKTGTGISRFQERLHEQLLQDQGTRFELDPETGRYNKQNLNKAADEAITLVEKNPDQALRIAKGLEPAPDGMIESDIRVATALKAKEEGNIKLWNELIQKNSLTLTRFGQEIVSVRGKFNDNSPENYVKKLLDTRMHKLGSNIVTRAEEEFGLNKSAKTKAVDKIDAEVTKLQKKIKTEATKDKIKLAQDIIDELTCK